MVDAQVYLDYGFTLLYICVWIFLGVHFVAGILKGRARMKFIEHKWPEHDSAPPPLPKFMHATHMISMIMLGFSGMMIRFPQYYGWRTSMRYTHYTFMIIVTVILVWRVWYAFFSKARDWREFAVTREDLASAIGVLAYYGYFSNKKPHVAKYNVMQKMSYILFLLMMVMIAFTGFSLLDEVRLFGTNMSELLIGWNLGVMVGSTSLAIAYVRIFHYILNWGFIIMTTVHVYLSATEDIPCTLDFFGLKALEVKEGAHGHGHDDEAHHEPPSVPPSPPERPYPAFTGE